MFQVKNIEIYASEIGELLNNELMGDDFIVNLPVSYKCLRDNSFTCITDRSDLNMDYLKQFNNVLLITSLDITPSSRFSVIKSKNPLIDFVKAANEFYIEYEISNIAATAKISSDAKIGEGVFIGENVVVGPEVVIGNNCKILNNTVITGKVEIGKNCVIKDNATIGSQGFDFVFDERKIPVRFPHLGRIIIGNDVWLGANTSIETGSLSDTIIGDFVKIDDLVQIGHDCKIAEKTMITAGGILSREVSVGKNCIIGPNASIRDEIVIGDNVVVGIGSVVINNLEADGVFVGNPARFLRKA